MNLNIGDLVTRNSYNNDVVFKITSIDNNNALLKGVNIRLIADSDIKDLKKHDTAETEDEKNFLDRLETSINLDRSDYFYLPGKILHIDSDKDYLKRCLDYYKKLNIWAMGINENEENIAENIIELLETYKPNIVVITGHDAYYKRKGKTNNINAYKNSNYFAKAIKKAREYENSHEKTNNYCWCLCL